MNRTYTKIPLSDESLYIKSQCFLFSALSKRAVAVCVYWEAVGPYKVSAVAGPFTRGGKLGSLMPRLPSKCRRAAATESL